MILSIFASAFNLQIQGRRRVREKLLHKREDRTNKQFVFLGEAYCVIKFTYKLEINFFEAGNIYCKPSGRRLVSSHRRFNVDIVSDLLTTLDIQDHGRQTGDEGHALGGVGGEAYPPETFYI